MHAELEVKALPREGVPSGEEGALETGRASPLAVQLRGDCTWAMMCRSGPRGGRRMHADSKAFSQGIQK